MVNDLRELMHELVENPPDDDGGLGEVLRAGRSRARRRRRGATAGLAAAGLVAAGLALGATGLGGTDGDRVAGRTVPRPDGPLLRLSQAVPAEKGTDYDVVASHTNKNLDARNGQYYDGVTDDGRILFRDGPRGPGNTTRLALLDPATGTKDWLPAHDAGHQPVAVELGRERLVLVTGTDQTGARGLRASVFDRRTRTWATTTWPGATEDADWYTARLGPDGRLYVGVPADGAAPSSTSPTAGPDGAIDDAGVEGERYDLWSVGLDDPGDVRDERLEVGAFAFTDDTLVWSSAANGTNDRIHVRVLATGAEHDFDPRSGERCNLLGLGATDDVVVLSQYCGTYADGRDDRVQVLRTDGAPVTTIQGDGIGGRVVGRLVQVTSYDQSASGTYVWEIGSGRFVRVSDGVSSWSLGGPTPSGYLLWDTPYGTNPDPEFSGSGATQWLARWRS